MKTTHPKAARWLPMAAIVVALATLAPSQGPRVSEIRGSVEIGVGTPPSWKIARSGDPIAPGDAVRTGAGATAELVLGTRTVRLYENSVLRIPAGAAGRNGPSAVELESGRSLFDVLRTGRGDRFDVRTPEVVVSVKGTRFLVDAGGAETPAAVAVFRGEVGVRALAQELAHEVRVRPGFTARGGSAGALELGVTSYADPWKAWSQDAPAPRPSAAPAAMPPAKAAARDAKAAAGKAAEREIREQGIELAPARLETPRLKPTTAGKPGTTPPAKLEPPVDGIRPGIPTDPISPIAPIGGETFDGYRDLRSGDALLDQTSTLGTP